MERHKCQFVKERSRRRLASLTQESNHLRIFKSPEALFVLHRRISKFYKKPSVDPKIVLQKRWRKNSLDMFYEWKNLVPLALISTVIVRQQGIFVYISGTTRRRHNLE